MPPVPPTNASADRANSNVAAWVMVSEPDFVFPAFTEPLETPPNSVSANRLKSAARK